MEMVTQSEKDALKAKLEELYAKQPLITMRIKEARELGDLRENAEYHAAREDQGYNEAEIRRLEDRLANTQVVDEGHKNMGVVYIGATVKLREEGSDEEETVRLVGEATGSSGDIFEATIGSPFGAALDKARVGEVISVRGPRGIKKFEILEIS